MRLAARGRWVILTVMWMTCVGAVWGCRRAEESAGSQPFQPPGTGQAGPASGPAEPTAPPPEEATAQDRSIASEVDLDEILRQQRLGGRLFPDILAAEPGAVGRLVQADADQAGRGFVLFVTRRPARVVLLDARGQVRHLWAAEDPRAVWERGLLLDGGDLIVAGGRRSRRGQVLAASRYALRVRADGQVVWQRPVVTRTGFVRLSDGRLATLTLREVSPTRIDTDLSLFSAEGELLESAPLVDVLGRGPGAFEPRQPRKARRSDQADWIEVTGLERVGSARSKIGVSLEPDDLVLTLRRQACIAIVRPGTRETLWTWGQADLNGPTHARLLPDGNLLVIDSHTGARTTRVLEVDPKSRRVVWFYVPEDETQLYAARRGVVQRLDNGNTLVVNARAGEIVQVSREGRIVWGYVAFMGAGEDRAVIGYAEYFEPAAIESVLSRMPASETRVP